MGNHLKRLNAPRSWKIKRKEHYWAPKVSPGPHSKDTAVTLGFILRDYLHICDTMSEAKKIFGSSSILVDGKVRKDIGYSCGFMDVISIPSEKLHYRILFDRRGKLSMTQIPAKNSSWKLERIENIVLQPGGDLQLNFHDGKNIIVDKSYKTHSTLKVKIPNLKIIGEYGFNEGNLAMIVGGKHAGRLGTIKEIEIVRSSLPSRVKLEEEKKEFSTVKPNVFVIGNEKPEIKLSTRKTEVSA